jgi:hypothetical protein
MTRLALFSSASAVALLFGGFASAQGIERLFPGYARNVC